MVRYPVAITRLNCFRLPPFAAAALLVGFGAATAAADLRGHGGPVRAVAVTADGKTAITGSFDTRAIVWSLGSGAAREVLLFHHDPNRTDDELDALVARYGVAAAEENAVIQI